MKNIFIFLLLISSISFGQQGIVWDSEISVSDGTTYGRFRPRMALTDNDVPVVVYGNSIGLYVSRWNGVDFDTPVSIMPSGMETYISGWTGPDIASKGDTVIVVFKQMPLTSGNVYSVRSTDGGITFSDTIRVDAHDIGVAWMPSVEMDELGNPVVSYMVHGSNWSNPDYVIAQSFDTGLNYTSEIDITTSIPGEVCDCCPSEMVINGSRRALLFRNNESNLRNMFAVMSIDDGTSYTSQEDVDYTNWTTNSCPSTGPDGVFFNNELLTVFTSGASGNRRVNLSSSDVTSGIVYANTYSIDDASLNQDYPRIAISNDTIIMVWREYFGTSSDVIISVATQGNYNQLLAEGVGASESFIGVQTNPDVLINNGVVYLCFQDEETGDVRFRTGSVNSVVSVEKIDESLSFSIYPNPSNTGEYVINGVIPSSIQIVDALGVVVNHESNDINTVKIKNPIKGIYFITAQTENGDSIVEKIILN